MADEVNTENPATTGEKKDDGRFVPNDPRINRSGRPKGRRDFLTDFEEAIKGIKDKQTGKQLTVEDIIHKGITNMMKGDAKFEPLYRDLLDRVYGKPTQSIDHTTGGEPFTDSHRDLAKKAIDDLLNEDRTD